MEKYEVGQIINSFKNQPEGVRFDLTDSGAIMLVFFDNPSLSEIEQFKAGNNFEIRFIEIYGVIMMTVKIGNFDWMDAPYSPHLSKNLTKFTIPNEGQGLGLTLMLVDTYTGEIKHIRMLGLSEAFTKRFFGTVMDEKAKEFNLTEYDTALNRIFSAYTTKQLVKMSKDYCKM